jgi:phosphatidylglycerophosphate synthase
LLNWKEFLLLAYPDNLKREDIEKRTFIFRAHRWIGLYLGYLFYHIGISANFIGITRIFISLFSLYFISLAIQSKVLLPFLGVLLLYTQHILDQCDGVVARAAGTVNKFGGRLDGISNALSRHAILILLSTFTHNITFMILASVISFFCVTVRDLFLIDNISYDIDFRGFAIFFRVVFSIQAMIFILPVFVVINNILNWSLSTFSYVSVSFYALVTFLWFLLSFYNFYKEN